MASGFSIDIVAPARVNDVLTARCVEVSRAGRTGVYDAEVTNQRGERMWLAPWIFPWSAQERDITERADSLLERFRLDHKNLHMKADYAPYGYLDSSGKVVGLEPDLAQDVADTLGVALELVPVVSSNRMQFLEQGKIDVMIATMTDTAERRGVVQIVDPNYYSSGTNILTKASFAKWEDLKGAPVCGIQGAFYNRKTSEEFGAEIVAFKGTAEALTALKQNRCVAFVYDDSFIVSRLAEADWQGWSMPLPTIDDAPWGLAVRKGEPALAAGFIVGFAGNNIKTS